ncbi:L-threonate dehydrogenase [Acidimangrovimonas sediminis]|uniref:L-threonate dehydrogenase n=1 Tax=Acidimangrovimonas sediminis TaxID=2056283 RepID=UPI000C7F893E|nr:L-threonate dehydrogenase [Acidimangrovimonas sediminis]
MQERDGTRDIAVIGLGSMGAGMALSLVRAGHRVRGQDIDPARITALVAAGGQPGAPADHAGALDAVVVVVLNAAQTEAVLFGPEGIAPRMRPGAVILSCATVPPAFARDMAARAATMGLHYLDAPISGGAAKAAEGRLSIMASGGPASFAAARPVLDAMAETVFDLGPEAGAGSAMKAVNQMLAGTHIAAMAEALTFGMTQGVAPATFLEVISRCAGTSWMLENRAPHVVAGDYSPKSQVNIWPKDLGIVLEIAREAGFEAPLAKAALGRFTEAAAQGLGQEDDAAVAKVYARAAGLTLPGETP